MSGREFYDYIIENFNLDAAASRLVHNIIQYIEIQGFVDPEDARSHLRLLLDGAIGIEDHEFELYMSQEGV